MIKLVVGLGNPGAAYEDTRHNAGFWFVDRLARLGNVVPRTETKLHGQVARTQLFGHELVLLKPNTFMNRSGQSVGAVMRFYKLTPADLLVVHDELDLAPGIARLKRGGGAGGHNGLKDISAQLNTQDYWRLRLGIGHPRDLRPDGAPAPSGNDVAHYVLKAPGRDDAGKLERALDDSLDVMPQLANGEFEAAMQRLHSVSR